MLIRIAVFIASVGLALECGVLLALAATPSSQGSLCFSAILWAGVGCMSLAVVMFAIDLVRDRMQSRRVGRKG